MAFSCCYPSVAAWPENVSIADAPGAIEPGRKRERGRQIRRTGGPISIVCFAALASMRSGHECPEDDASTETGWHDRGRRRNPRQHLPIDPGMLSP